MGNVTTGLDASTYSFGATAQDGCGNPIEPYREYYQFGGNGA
jgi:hypothetical protein